jgi:hypothetical protein
VKRKAVPTLPPATTAQFKPEPVLAKELYEHILKVVQDMALVMERIPDAFKAMNEEALRQHFLVQLNGQFEGKPTSCCARVTAMSSSLSASSGKDRRRSARPLTSSSATPHGAMARPRSSSSTGAPKPQRY